MKSGEINPHVKEAWKVTKSGVKGTCIYIVHMDMHVYTCIHVYRHVYTLIACVHVFQKCCRGGGGGGGKSGTIQFKD